MQNIKTEFDNQALEILTKYQQITESKKQLEAQESELKQELEQLISNQGLTKYYVENYTAYQVKDRTTATLNKEAKATLLATNPDYFTTTEGKPSFTIRINGAN